LSWKVVARRGDFKCIGEGNEADDDGWALASFKTASALDWNSARWSFFWSFANGFSEATDDSARANPGRVNGAAATPPDKGGHPNGDVDQQ
jgi:hypothetical protein